MEISFFTEIEKQKILTHLEELLRLQKEKTKKEWQDTPISNAEFIEMMKISPRTAQSWRDNGMIDYFKIGEKIYYNRSAIEKMFETHRIKSFKGI